MLKLHKDLAPIKIAVLPLMKNKEDIVAKAKEVFDSLRREYMVQYDQQGSIGKRYRKQDEIGTLYCVTIDFDTLEKGVVTVRDRDTMEQESIEVDKLVEYFSQKI